MQSVYGTIMENVVRRLRQNNIIINDNIATRIVGMVHATKGQYASAFANMEVVGRSCNNKVQAIYTPNGTLKSVNVHESINALSPQLKRRAIVSACAEALHKGHTLRAEAEEQIYAHFLLSIGTLLNKLDDTTALLLQTVSPKESMISEQWEKQSEYVQTQLSEKMASALAARVEFEGKLNVPNRDEVFGDRDSPEWLTVDKKQSPPPKWTSRGMAIQTQTASEAKAKAGGGDKNWNTAPPGSMSKITQIVLGKANT
jgi:DNA-binding protein YbaB